MFIYHGISESKVSHTHFRLSVYDGLSVFSRPDQKVGHTSLGARLPGRPERMFSVLTPRFRLYLRYITFCYYYYSIVRVLQYYVIILFGWYNLRIIKKCSKRTK